MSCIFCKIINKEIPSSVVYENEYVVAILDLSQANEGHTLVMPKKHFDNILQMDDVNYQELMKAVHIVSKAIDKAFKPEGINIINNCKEAAGQTVMHTHVHIIPRYKNDSIKMEYANNEGKFNLEDVKNKIINSL